MHSPLVQDSFFYSTFYLLNEKLYRHLLRRSSFPDSARFFKKKKVAGEGAGYLMEGFNKGFFLYPLDIGYSRILKKL